MLPKNAPWGLTAFALAALGLLCASLVSFPAPTLVLAGMGLLLVGPGLAAAWNKGQTLEWIWLVLGGCLSVGVLALALFFPRLLNQSWQFRPGNEGLIQTDRNRQLLVHLDHPQTLGKTLADDAWVDAAQKGIRQDDLFIRLGTVKIGQLPAAGVAPLLLIQFQLTQISSDQKIVFPGFAKDVPTLTDNTGRKYTFLGHQIRKERTRFDIGLNEDHWLKFKLPPGPLQVDFLQLEVPAAAWSRHGTCKFLIKTIENDAPTDMPKLIAHYKDILNKSEPAPDLALGRRTFVKQCIECHTFFGIGNKTGPELTDWKFEDGRLKRHDRDFLVTNIVDPSAEIAKDYKPSLVVTTLGQVIIGIVITNEETADSILLQTAGKKVAVKKKDIEAVSESKKSLMPEGLLKPLDDHEVRSLFAYLAAPAQTPLLATPENAVHFHTGKDFGYWRNPNDLWKLDNGNFLAPGPQAGKPARLLSDFLLADDFEVFLRFHPGKEGRGAILLLDEQDPEPTGNDTRLEFAAGEPLAVIDVKGVRHTHPAKEAVQANAWNTLKINKKGKDLSIRFNGNEKILTLDDSSQVKRRRVALEGPASTAAGSEIRFGNLALWILSAPK